MWKVTNLQAWLLREMLASLLPWVLGLEQAKPLTGLEGGGCGGGASVICHTHVRKHLFVGGDTSGSFHSGRDCGARGFVGDFFFFSFLLADFMWSSWNEIQKVS